MPLFQILALENDQRFENFEIISYTYFFDSWIQQEIPFLLI